MSDDDALAEAREHLIEFDARFHEHSEGWIAQMDGVADGDDELRVRMVAAHLALVEEHADRMRDYRDDAAARLREAGVPMTRIAKLARVNDSALARRLFKRGGCRRVQRGGLAVTALLGGWLVVSDIVGNLFSDPASSAAVAFLTSGGQ